MATYKDQEKITVEKCLSWKCEKTTNYSPGDMVEWVIKVTNNSDEPCPVAVTDDFPEPFIDLVGSEDLFDSVFDVPGPIGLFENFATIPAGVTVTYDLKATIDPEFDAELCGPCSFHNCVTVCLSGEADPGEDRCECWTAQSEGIVIGDRDELKLDPECFPDMKSVLNCLLTNSKPGPIIDYVNKGGSLTEIMQKACEPAPPPEILTPEVLQEICDLVIAKFDSPELKAAIVACLTGPDNPITKDILGTIIQAEG